MKLDRCKRMAICCQEDTAGTTQTARLNSLKVDHSPPLLLNIALALQHVLVQVSVCMLSVGVIVQGGERVHMAASVFFYSGISTLLQSYFGSRLPLVQAPSLDFLVPALVLLSAKSGTAAACRGQCAESEASEAPTHTVREFQGMAVVAGLVQLTVGLSGLGGALLGRCGPLVLTPVLCMLGFSIYREAALLCSDHWGFALLTVALLVCLSQHLHSWSMRFPQFQVFSMLAVLLSMVVVWTVCAALYYCEHFQTHSVSELLLDKTDINISLIQDWHGPNSSSLLFSDASPAWISLPLPGLGLPLLSGPSIAAGVAAGLSSSVSSQAVYVLTGRLLKAPTIPAQACNRGLSVEGLSSVLAGLMGAPVGLCSSVANACTVGLSQCGFRGTVQLAGVMLLVLGIFQQLTHLLTSIPLAIHGAVLTVTYTVAAATGITYLQYTDVDSGRNIFNTGFTVFMCLVLPRWFRMQSGFIYTGVPSLDIFLQSCLMLPVFLIGFLSFLLDHTVSGTLSERGLERDRRTNRIRSLVEKHEEAHQSAEAVYEPPWIVKRVLSLRGLRSLPFCACRNPDEQKIVTYPEMSSLLPL